MTSGDDDHPQHPEATDHTEVFGPIDPGALRTIRDLFVELEPLVETATLDDPLNPQTLTVELADGIRSASTARIEIRWSLTGNYAAHYTDEQNQNWLLHNSAKHVHCKAVNKPAQRYSGEV